MATKREKEESQVPVGYGVSFQEDGSWQEVLTADSLIPVRYPSEEHARRVAYQILVQRGCPVRIHFCAGVSTAKDVGESKLMEEADPDSSDLLLRIEKDYPEVYEGLSPERLGTLRGTAHGITILRGKGTSKR